MTTITPTRFGLKYAPIPTLSLEYEEDLGIIDDENGTRSLYVFKEQNGTQEKRPRMRKKVHVVELPNLTSHSEPQAIVQQLQKENGRFLGPNVVKEQQLRRLLQQLVGHLQHDEGAKLIAGDGRPAVVIPGRQDEVNDEDNPDDHNESMMDESIASVSASLDASTSNSAEETHTKSTMQDERVAPSIVTNRGAFISQEESDHDQDDQPLASLTHEDGGGDDLEPSASRAEDPNGQDQEEEAADARKRQTLKSDSDESDGDGDEVQSEELEYFSEDGSDEDSF